jgi:hypothetical protein
LRLTLRHLFRVVAQGIEFCGQGLHGGQDVISVAVLSDELAADFGGAQTRIQSGGAKLGVGLTLTIHNGFDIGQQGGQVVFHTLPATGREGIQTGETTFQLMGALADGHPTPAEGTFGAPLPARAQFFDGTCHEEPTGTAVQ